MNKIWLITKREYISRVRSRSFLIATLLAPAGFALFLFAMIFIVGSGESEKRIAVIDESGLFKNREFEDSLVYFFPTDSSREWMEQNYQRLNYDGILLIPANLNIKNPNGITYRSEKQFGLKTEAYIEEKIEKLLKEIKIERANVDKSVLKDLDNTQVSIRPFADEEEGENTDTWVATGMGYIMGILIYTVLFVYGAMVMKGVMEEKSSRIMEVLASSVRPFQLMMGKVIGIGAVGLTQFTLWFIMIAGISFVFGIAFSGQIAEIQQVANNQAMSASPDQEEAARAIQSLFEQDFLSYILYFIFYFLGGYLIYGSLYAALGSAINEEGDSQSLTMFVSLPIIISIFIMMSAVQEPESKLAVWASIFPLSAPIVMPARIPFNVDSWQIAASMISVVAGFIFTTWFSAKIYRTGILMYGKKVTLKELWKWTVKSEAF